MAGFGDLFGKGSTAEQFLIWGVLQQLLQPLLLPFTTELQKLVLSAAPDVPLSAQTAAAAVARGTIDFGTGQDIANDNGIGENDFRKLIRLAQTGPDLGTAVAAFQRGIVHAGGDDPNQLSLFGALTDAGLRPEWHDVVRQLAVQLPSAAEIMDALLKGQISRGEALTRWKQTGMDETWFQAAYDSGGEAPTPTQALELANRGIIPWDGEGPHATSYRQAFLEGPWRNKWEPVFRALAEYVPPPRTITAMFHQGQLDHAQAVKYLMMNGLSGDLAAAYLAPAHHQSTTADKVLAKGDVLALYRDKLMNRAEAVKALEALKYSAHDAAELLDLADFQTAAAAIRAGTTRTRALYRLGKIGRAEAVHALEAVGMKAPEAEATVATWDTAHAAQVKELTGAQIESGVFYGLITEAEGYARLQALGYDDADAWLALAVRLRSPLKTIPRPAGLGPEPGRVK